MNEQEEWRAAIDRADSVKLKVIRLRTYLAYLTTDIADHTAEITNVRQEIAALKEQA